MNFFVFEGFLGAGKTLGACIYAKYYQEKSGCALYSNCGLLGAKPFTSLDDFKLIAQEESSILVLDEAHMDLDARSFSSNHVKFFTQLSYYLRKLRCTLIITSPSFGDLDTRIRNITNVLAFVSKDSNYFRYELWDVQSNRFIKRMRIRKENAFKISASLFDTNSMVTPVQMPKNKDDFKDFLDELKYISENYYKSGEHSTKSDGNAIKEDLLIATT